MYVRRVVQTGIDLCFRKESTPLYLTLSPPLPCNKFVPLQLNQGSASPVLLDLEHGHHTSCETSSFGLYFSFDTGSQALEKFDFILKRNQI